MNFSRFFQDLPDLTADLVECVNNGKTAWMEWRMRGTRADGTVMEFVGVNILGIEGDVIRWGRINSELCVKRVTSSSRHADDRRELSRLRWVRGASRRGCSSCGLESHVTACEER